MPDLVINDYLRNRIKEVGFWFVDVPRTSSTSIKSQLADRYGKVFGKQGIRQGVRKGLIADHTTAAQMCGLLGAELWDDLYTFAVVRNPWDRLVSMYYFRQFLAKEIDSNFDAYVDALYHLDSAPSDMFMNPVHYSSNADMICDADGNLLISHVVRYEHRQQDLASVAQRIAVPELGQGQWIGKTDHTHYSLYYNDVTRQQVAELYARDIELFGYQFEQK